MSTALLAQQNPARGYGLRAGVIGLCAFCLVSLWLGLWLQMRSERDILVRAKMAENRNLVTVFEEHVVRTLSAASMTLTQIVSDYQRLGVKFDIATYAESHRVENRPYANLSVVNQKGEMILQSLRSSAPANLSDDDAFKYHAARPGRELFIGKPRKAWGADRWTFSLSRRVDNFDGSFGGLVSIDIDTEYFAAFYKRLDLGPNAVVSLIGKDGIVRARQLGGKFDADFDARKSPLFTAQLPAAQTGSYVGASPSDGDDKIFAYCAIAEYPLVVLVGSSHAALLATHQQRWSMYFGATGGVTVVVLFFLALAMQQIAKREKANRELAQSELSLRESEERFKAFMDNCPAIAFIKDAEGRCIYFNHAWELLYGSDWRGKKVADLWPAQNLERFEETDRRTLEAGECVESFEKIPGKDGAPRHWWVMKFPILDSSGRRLVAGFRLDMTERRRAEEGARASEQSIRRLYEITNAAELSFDERVRALLALGCERFGLAHGLVTRACGDELEVRYSHSADGSFSEGMKIPRSAAYCSSVMAADEPLCYGNIGQSVWREHPGYLALGMECYMGTKVVVDGRVYGTLCFLRTEPRDGEFSEAERDFLKLMAVWIGGALERHQAHWQLQRSHDQIRQILDVDPNFIFAKDRAGRFTLVNKALADAYGTTVENLVGKTDADFNANAAEVEFFRQTDNEVMDSIREKFIPEIAFSDANGNRRWMQTVKRPIVGADGRADQVLGSATDITARKWAEDELRFSEEQYRLTFEKAAVGVAHVGLDGRWLRVNPKVCEITGYAREELLRLTFQDITHPDDLEAIILERDRSLAGEIDTFSMEKRYIRKDGGIVWVNLDVSLVRDATGAPRHFISVLHDISDRRQAEQLLRESEARYARATAVGKVGVWEVNFNTQQYHGDDNLKAMFGYAPDELGADPIQWLRLVHPDDRQIALNSSSAVVAGKIDAYECELRMVRKDGSIIWTEIHGEVTRSGAHQELKLIGTTVDITARKLAEIKLRESESRLRTIIDAEPECVKVVARDGQLIEMNAAGLRMLEADSLAAIADKNLLEFVLPDYREAFVDLHRKVIDGRGDTLEFEIVGLKGQRRRLETHAAPLRDANGEVIALLGVTRDITDRKAAETDRARLAAIVENSGDAIISRGLDLKVLTWNRAAERMFGYSAEEVIGRATNDFFIPADRLAEVAEKRELMSRGEPVPPYDTVRLGRNGRPVDVSITQSPIRDASGCVTGVSLTMRDISERKRADEALRAAREELEQRVHERTAELSRTNNLLRASEERLQHALTVGKMGTWEREFATGREEWDQRSYEIFGFAPGTAVDLETFISRIHPDDLGAVREAIQLTERTGAAYDCDYRVIKTDGKLVWIHAIGGLRCDSAGVATHIAGINFDITERKQAEDALRESESRMRAILDHSPAPVFIKDTGGRYVHVNRRFEELFAIPSADSVGKTDAELFASEQAQAFQANDRRVLALGYAIQFEELAQYHDGEHTSIVTKFPLRDSQGKIYGLCGIVTDITGRKAAEEALRKLNEELDQRVARRTQELAESQARLRALVGEITKTEERERRRLAVELHDYLAQMLTVSRLNIGRAGKRAVDEVMKNRLAEAQQSVDDSIAYTRSLMAQLSPRVLYELGLPAALNWLASEMLERHGLSVEVAGESDGVNLDEERSVLAFQCARELLWNIVKHAQTNSASMSYDIQRGELSIEVADGGCGFDPETLRGNGGGLEKFGLFSVRERLELLGGRLEVISQLGRGTTVRLNLPAPTGTLTTAAIHEHLAPPAVTAAATKRLSVALVDDHEVVRRGLRQVLEECADLTVVGEAKDGVEGVELAREFRPDVVVMDVNMPRMNGIEATRLITQELPSTIVVGLSFDSGEQVRQAMKASGASSCITKERAVEDIHQAIIEAVEERRELKMDN
jgi:PAS domain S-box-containing protein